MGKKSRLKKEKRELKKVLFVCTANVCRSPMAEKLFARAVENSSLPQKIVSYSAGLSAMDGDKASQNSMDACEEIGVDISDHRSAGLTRTRPGRCLGHFLYDRVTPGLDQYVF